MSRIRVLYLVYWGAAEPLGQSLVLPSVMRLAKLASITLVTFEKAADLEREEEIARIRALLRDHGVRWVALRYHKRPKWPATFFDVFNAVVRSLASARRGRPHIVHARTFIGGVMGLVLAPLLGARLLYHNEGFYPDEQVDGGVWQAGSLPHRVTRAIESGLYARADGIAAMSFRARTQIEALPIVARRRTPVIVVPSCVDLESFRRPSLRQAGPLRARPLRLIYIGSIGYRYIFDRIAAFVAVAARRPQGARLRVLTPADPAVVDQALRSVGVPHGTWSVDRVPHARMPEELAAQDAGLFFLTRGISEHGCSPTKIGEYWAMGLPVVTTANVGDTDEIVRHGRVGVVVEEHNDETYARALAELEVLLEDPALPARCRRAAEGHYGLDVACERQAALYRKLAPGVGQSASNL